MNALETCRKTFSWNGLLGETGMLLEAGSLLLSLKQLKAAPDGRGRPVMIIPGFLTGDWATQALQTFLNLKNFAAYGWCMGTNLARCNRTFQDRLYEQLSSIHHRHGRKVYLAGHSLGGIYAYLLALWYPELIEAVVTIGSPLNSPQNGVQPLVRQIFKWITRKSVHEVSLEFERELKTPLSIPATFICAARDRVVSLDCAAPRKPGPKSEVLILDATHCGLVSNKMVCRILADRFSTDADQWHPFRQWNPEQFLDQVTEPVLV